MTPLIYTTLALTLLVGGYILCKRSDRRAAETGQQFELNDWVKVAGRSDMWFVEDIEHKDGVFIYTVASTDHSMKRQVRGTQLAHP